MSRQALCVSTTAVFAAMLVLLCTSCTTSQPAPPRLDTTSANAARLRWEQVSFGADARFVACTECPRVTPKTLAVAPEAVVSTEVSTTLARPAAPESSPPATPFLAPNDGAPPARSAERPVTSDELHRSDVVITFPVGSARLNEAARSQLRRALKSARLAKRIVIAGRTDDSGSDKLNENLALARAVAVRNYFRDIAPDLGATFSIRARGRCCFVATNSDEAGRSQNRRVEVQFADQKGA